MWSGANFWSAVATMFTIGRAARGFAAAAGTAVALAANRAPTRTIAEARVVFSIAPSYVGDGNALRRSNHRRVTPSSHGSFRGIAPAQAFAVRAAYVSVRLYLLRRSSF